MSNFCKIIFSVCTLFFFLAHISFIQFFYVFHSFESFALNKFFCDRLFLVFVLSFLFSSVVTLHCKPVYCCIFCLFVLVMFLMGSSPGMRRTVMAVTAVTIANGS